MNLPVLFSLLALTSTPSGTVLTATGAAGTIQRGAKTQTIRAGDTLTAGDTLQTGGDALTLLLGKELFVCTFGPCQFELGDADAELLLRQGEFRFTTEGTTTVRSAFAKVTARASIWRVAAIGGNTFVKCESGAVNIQLEQPLGLDRAQPTVRFARLNDDQAIVCQAGEQYIITSDGTIRREGFNWQLDAQRVALSGAARRGRQELEEWALNKSRDICQTAQFDSCRKLFDDETIDQPQIADSMEPYAPPADVAADTGSQGASEVDSVDSAQDYISSFNNAPLSSVTPISSLATASVGAGGNNPDAGQSTLAGMLPNGDPFPGSIHLLTSETRYALNGLNLSAAERTQLSSTEYWSIGLGSSPTSQVTTSFLTASGVDPTVVRIPNLNAYIVRLDQFGITDPVNNDPTINTTANVGVAGLVGTPPTAPIIDGADPLLDTRGASASFNSGATFALGEFRSGVNAEGDFEIAIRRSAQDRTIVKDPNGNDAQDQVVVNPEIPLDRFVDVSDPLFQPAAPTVKAPLPNALDSTPTRLSRLNVLRRAATTTLVAEKLYEFSRRTGQTRFVIDGQIIDISGYQRP